MPKLIAELRYTLEVTEAEIGEIISALSEVAGRPGQSRDTPAYELLQSLYNMVEDIKRHNEALEKASNPKPETPMALDVSQVSSQPPVVAFPSVPTSDTEDQGTSGDPEANKAPESPLPPPPAPPTFPLSLPPAIAPAGPPPSPPGPKRGSKETTVKGKKKKRSKTKS